MGPVILRDEVEILDLGRIQRRFQSRLSWAGDGPRGETSLDVGVIGVLRSKIPAGTERSA